MTRDFARKASAGADLLKYRRNARVELDRLIFEYVTGVWRGSGDSRIASNLKRLASSGPDFAPVPAAEWKLLVEGIVERGEIRGVSYTAGVDRRVMLLLYYRNMIRGLPRLKPGVMNDVGVHIDHILPQELFSIADSAQARFQHHIVNLSPLPARLNILKRNRTLKEIQDPVMQAELATYVFLQPKDFEIASNVGSVEQLSQLRGEELLKDLTFRRETYINAGAPVEPLASAGSEHTT
jgi:hypothetical protein